MSKNVNIVKTLTLDTSGRKGPLVEIILDGCGDRIEAEYNCFAFAYTPFLDYIMKKKSPLKQEIREIVGETSYVTLTAVGEEVGMPPGAKGSTAVGHEVLSGVPYEHPMLSVNRAINEEGLIENKEINELLSFVIEHNSALHLLGLVSNNQEHSHIKHLYAILNTAITRGVEKIYIHFFSDGRGTPPHSAPRFAEDLSDRVEEMLAGRKNIEIIIATVAGRDIAMNRSKLYWSKTEKTYRAIVEGEGPKVPTLMKALRKAYDMGLNDQYIPPAVIGDYKGFSNYDGVMFWNFRKDRTEFMVRMMVDPLEDFTRILRESGDETYKDIQKFERVKYKQDLDFNTVKVCALIEYYENVPCPVAFRAVNYEWSLGGFLSHFGFKQIRMSGVDKAKAIALLSGGKREDLFPGEERIIIPLPDELRNYIKEYEEHKGEEGYKIDPYAKYPHLELRDLCKKAMEVISDGDEKTCIMMNIANPDMVGHTADIMACITAMEKVDQAVQRISLATLKKKFLLRQITEI
ncbi:MAG: 2,3-bisphosphoglycerate-independent phosphoglycerate mutase [bacterium ADurb.Bin363]|nr:MAG: 2,3-bisphosphoglycerate-independent phosphoglycerate mutase [bacterium ADurb.Bin363]